MSSLYSIEPATMHQSAIPMASAMASPDISDPDLCTFSYSSLTVSVVKSRLLREYRDVCEVFWQREQLLIVS